LINGKAARLLRPNKSSSCQPIFTTNIEQLKKRTYMRFLKLFPQHPIHPTNHGS
jgi:hypothetical protein